jgi:outer membrane protein OmpA-like peptidoglycan-associated protein
MLLVLLAIVAIAATIPVMALTPPPLPIVFFESASSAIGPEADNALKAAVDDFQRRPDRARIDLRAHTDGAEARTSSSALSPARGDAVKKRLVELGVPADRIEIWAFTDSQPLVGIQTGAAEPKNRRVEIYVYVPKQ